MKKSYDNLPYEFLLRINGKPIVGRNFHIKGYNSDSLKSIELKETIDEATGVIEEQFKLKPLCNSNYRRSRRVKKRFI